MKKLVVLLLACALLLTAAGCGQTKTLDLEAIAAELLGGESLFTDIMNSPADDVALKLYRIDEADVDEVVLYCGTGATAEEIALFHAVDETAASRVQEAVELRISQQMAAFADYVPEEVPKLQSALVKTYGCYVLLVVSSDASAADVILSAYL